MSTTKRATRVGVFIGEGTRPTAENFRTDVFCESWSVFAGGRLAEAELKVDVGQTGRLRNITLQAFASRQVELWTIDPTDEDDIRVSPLFWGEIVGSRMRIIENDESEVLIARVMPYHFGDVIDGQHVQRVTGGGPVETTVDIPLEFNPMVDGRIIDNMHQLSEGGDRYWIDPESTRTPDAKTYHGGTVSPWTLGDACKAFLKIWNDDEDFIDNPTGGWPTDAQEIVNTVLAVGQGDGYLPGYLDAITQKHGHNWSLTFPEATIEGDRAIKPKIGFWPQNSGSSVTVKIQDVGNVLSLEGTNTAAASIDFSVGGVYNVLTGWGAVEEREVTVPLYRAWDIGSDGDEDHADVNNIIGRKFVGNEGGDYTGLRTEITAPAIMGDDDDWIVKRRPMEDCITYRSEFVDSTASDEGFRHPAFAEYSDDEGVTWKPVPNEWGFRVLPNEIGIYFTGVREDGETTGGIPPEALDVDNRFRITGTVRGDKRLKFTLDSMSGSPNSSRVERIIDLSDRFFDRRRAATGEPFESELTGEADIRDDATALENYITAMAPSAKLAQIDADITLFGLNFDYNISDIITKIEGREISFNRAPPEATAAYVQIVGITWRNGVGNQSTTLHISPYGTI